MIINEVGTHAGVKALVFVAAFEPDVGESVADLSDKMPAAAKSVGPVGDGFLAVDPDALAADFAADARKPVARLMAMCQVPVAGDAFKATATVAARSKTPSNAVTTKQERMINPDLERFMAGSPAAQVSRFADCGLRPSRTDSILPETPQDAGSFLDRPPR